MVFTFKIVTLSAALEEGLVDLENEYFYDGGSINVEGARIKFGSQEDMEIRYFSK